MCLGFVLGAYLCLPTVCNACPALLSMETDGEPSWWRNVFSPAKREAVATAWQCMVQWGRAEERHTQGTGHADVHIPIWITPKHRILIQRLPLMPRPLHRVVESNQPWMAVILLTLGSNPNVRNVHDRTPLHLAVARNNPEVAEVLLRYGADPHAQDERGHTPLTGAWWGRENRPNMAMVDLLRNHID